MQLAASDTLGRPLPAILEFLARMAISVKPGGKGDEEKVSTAAITKKLARTISFPGTREFPVLVTDAYAIL